MRPNRITAKDAAAAIYREGRERGRALYLEDRGNSYPYRYAIGEIVRDAPGYNSGGDPVGSRRLAETFADGTGTGLFEKSPRDILAVLALGKFRDQPPPWAEFVTYEEIATEDHYLGRVGKDALATLGRDERTESV